MTQGWIVINIVLCAFVSAIVAGTSILVPHTLHRRHMADLRRERAAQINLTPRHDGAVALADRQAA